MIKGEKVILIEKKITGLDLFGKEIYSEEEIEIDNVIIGSPTFDQSTESMQLEGKKLAFTLGIPKCDKHDWKDKVIIIRGMRFKSYGFPLVQTSANVPGKWNTQVKVERYE